MLSLYSILYPLYGTLISCTRSAYQMCCEDSGVILSAEVEIAAEESLSVYCQPVELYNILQRRAKRNVIHHFFKDVYSTKYRRSAEEGICVLKCRIQMTISLSGTVNEDKQAQSPFPLYILLARLVSDVAVAQHSAVYRFSRACILTDFSGVEGSTQVHATFNLSEINKLAWKAKSGSLAFLLVNFAGTPNSLCGTDLSRGRLGMMPFSSNDGGHCILGKIPLEELCVMWEKSPDFSLGQRAEVTCPVDMHSCFLKLSCLNKDKCLSIQMPVNSGASSMKQQVHVIISAEESGAKEKSPYNSYTCSDVSSPSLSRIIRLRAGNVVFNYRYDNNKLQRSEVTEDFSCPFCLMKCGSFKVTEEYQAVNVSVKTDSWRSENWLEIPNLLFQMVLILSNKHSSFGKSSNFSFFVVCSSKDSLPYVIYVYTCLGATENGLVVFYSSRRHRYKRSKSLVQRSKHVNPLVLEAHLPSGVCELHEKADDFFNRLEYHFYSLAMRNLLSGGNGFRNASTGVAECAQPVPSSFNVVGVSSAAAQSCTDPGCLQSVSGNNLAPPAMLQFAKTRKLSIERSDPRNRTLQKRQFFHSQRAKPMAIEQVMSDRDSEDEVDDDVADLEDRRMLDDFVDVTKDEKQIMHLWNSFVRKQRVLADGHIPWVCEAFTRLHGHDLVQAPALIWCWRLFMIKLWNHGFLDARSMNNCNIVLEQFQKQDLEHKN
ncbi:hypothetical protein EZV62_004939 [Acer yangbiense]|uniref:Uncharacterized protein n=1 Tax=Acer yangbiense TaxID=1000413 RepID=A0A5C7IMG0_9ROSI|nr:hypothetical protein EZV62_004939 [Acer yangbiense]